MRVSQSVMMAVDVAASNSLQQALEILHYLSPAVVIAYHLLAVTVSICALHNLTSPRTSPRRLLLGLMSAVLFSYVVEACMLLIDTLIKNARFSGPDINASENPRLVFLI